MEAKSNYGSPIGRLRLFHPAAVIVPGTLMNAEITTCSSPRSPHDIADPSLLSNRFRILSRRIYLILWNECGEYRLARRAVEWPLRSSIRKNCMALLIGLGEFLIDSKISIISSEVYELDVLVMQ